MEPAKSEAVDILIQGMRLSKSSPQFQIEREIASIKTILTHLHRASGAKFRVSLNNLAESIDKLATLSFNMGVEAGKQHEGKQHGKSAE
jgi:hypothetical protein